MQKIGRISVQKIIRSFLGQSAEVITRYGIVTIKVEVLV